MHIEKDCLLLQYLVFLLVLVPPTDQLPPNSSLNAHLTLEYYLNKQYQHLCYNIYLQDR